MHRLVFAVFLSLCNLATGDPAAPLPQAHAHNDYLHARPLLDALDHGFCSVEADIFLVDGELRVGHSRLQLRKGRTLESLYLKPLAERVRAHHGSVYPTKERFILLVDIKDDSAEVYPVLDALLERYRDMLTSFVDETHTPRAVTVILSGDRPRALVAADPTRYCSIDGRLTDLGTTAPPHLVPLISDDWRKHFKWRGAGGFPAEEAARLNELVARARREHRLIRFWGTPDTVRAWPVFLNAGVDLLNTDHLPELAAFLRSPSKPIVLASNGNSGYVITIPATPAAPVQTAARELQEHLRMVTGVTLPVVSEDKVADHAPQILVGPVQRLAQLVPGLDLDTLGHDGIVIRTAGDKLILAGQGTRGTLNAVYSFLEDVVGCRWWTSEESFVPNKPVLEIPPLNVSYAPPLRYREAFYRDTFGGTTAARFRLNGHHHQVPPEFGGHYRFVGFVHSFFPLLPPERHFQNHPEWYSEINGVRTAEQAQLCLTNDQMRAELTKVALERLRSDPGAGFISISQNDWHGQCQCTACRAVEENEGSASGPLIRFVNAVAADIEKEFPEVLVETLAYQYTRKPPQHVKPRHNVVVRLCSIECSFVQPLGEGGQNEAFRRDIEGWSKISPQLFIWDYVTNFSNYLVPHPNLHVLAPNIRYFVEHRTIGLFEQGDSQSGIGDFLRLRAWLLAHLMWDPTRDETALTREFMEGYYGPAAPHLLEYLDVIQKAGEQSGVFLRCFMEDTASYLTLDDLNRATRHFAAAAEAVAGDPVRARRVRRERLPLDHVWLRRHHALRRQATFQQKDFLGPDDPVAACGEFLRLAHEFGVGNYRENRPFTEYEDGLRQQFRPAGPPPAECAGLAVGDWIDLQDHQFRLARPGEWASLVDDPKASDGKAARMPGNHLEWATACPLSDDMAAGHPWRCFVVARVEATGTDGVAMTMGIYDSNGRRSLAHRSVPVSEVSDGQYRTFDLGVHPVNGGTYVWVAPTGRPDDVQAVFVDRMFLVRPKGP